MVIIVFFGVLAFTLTALIISIRFNNILPYWLMFWSYKEIRMMFAACVVICFLSIMPINISIYLNSSSSITIPEKIELGHKLNGSYLSPVQLEIKNK